MMELRTPRDIGRQASGCRRFYKLRQGEVARAVGVSRQWIGDLEKGKPTLELGLVLRAFEELGLELTVKRGDAPPAWTRPLTFEAEHRESRTIYGNRRRAKDRRDRNWEIRQGNREPDPVLDKDWQRKEDEYYEKLVKGWDMHGDRGPPR